MRAIPMPPIEAGLGPLVMHPPSKVFDDIFARTGKVGETASPLPPSNPDIGLGNEPLSLMPQATRGERETLNRQRGRWPRE